MNKSISPEIKELMEVVHYRPAISIILPFEPKMGLKEELTYSLKIAAAKAEQQLMENYPDYIISLVMQKIRNCIKNLNFNTHKKSIAIYVSPVFEKVLYLDMAVEEKIIVDESFEIRDLVYSKKQLHKYLVLMLSAKQISLYLGNSETFANIISTTSVHSIINEVPERVANFSDMSERKEIIMDKFLLSIDNTLNIILNAYRLPLFVLGTERILGHFKSLTKHGAAVIEYIPGNYEDATPQQLKKIMEPYVSDWKAIIQRDLLNKLEEAADKKKLAVGIKNVWREAMQNKGRLLAVEKNYMYAAEHGSSDDSIDEITPPYNKFSYIKDAVDDIIEKVLENGGEVEFTDEDTLKDYQHIALVQFY
jgi:Bacterial archaeo-eukaryotic release factor family 3